MGIGGVSQGGASIVGGPTRVFGHLPFRGYREWLDDNSRAWVQEFIDAIGAEFDIWDIRFIRPAARANLLDPTYTPTEVATSALATATAAPTSATVQHTMLDILQWIAGVPFPSDTNLTIAQRQALVAIGWDALKRKGNRLQLLRLAAAYGDGIAYGWTVPPFTFSVMFPDGAPSPGFGSWVPASGAAATQRPWLFAALRNHFESKTYPAWSKLGIGYSQFRASYSGADEPVFPSGARLNLLLNEHFKDWSVGLPVNWSQVGAGTITQGTSGTPTLGANINFEFSSSLTVLDLTAAAAGVQSGLCQEAVVESEINYRVQLDYAYRQAAAPFVSKLVVQVIDLTNSYYYNTATGAWQATQYDIPIAPSAAAGTRTRHAFDLPVQVVSGAGQHKIRICVQATSDGTASSQLSYGIYRVGLFEKFDIDEEEDAGGERTLWLPLRTTVGYTSPARAGGNTILEPSNGLRSSYKKYSTSTTLIFPHHPALAARGLHCTATWTNLVKGSHQFNADWTVTNATRAFLTGVSPDESESAGVSETATTITATAVNPVLRQASIVADPSSKSYIAGLWVKKATADTISPAGTVSVSASGTTVTGSGTSFDSTSWVGRTIRIGTNSYPISAVASGTSLTIGVPAVVAASASAFTISADDVTLTLESVGGASVSRTFTLTQSEGWRWLAMPAVTFGAGDTFPLRLSVAWTSAHSTGQILVATSYVYDVTGKDGVLYPPVCETDAGSTGTVGATTTTAVIASGTANLHHLTRRLLTDLASGQLNLTVVPTFDGESQPDGTIFDFGQTLTRNRIALRVVAGFLKLSLFDNGSTERHCSLEMQSVSDPVAGAMTWRRDTAITIRARWSSTVGLDLTAGNGVARETASLPWTVSNASLAGIGVGNNFTGGAGQFDGILRDLEVIQIGAPA